MPVGDVTRWMAGIFLALAILAAALIGGAVLGQLALSPFVMP